MTIKNLLFISMVNKSSEETNHYTV